MKNYLMTVDGDGENIFETSFVEYPATEREFLFFSKQKEQVKHKFAQLNGSFQRMVSGVWMMPNTKYPRFDETKQEYYTVEFTEESLQKALLKHLKSGFSESFKVEHEGKTLDGFKTIEYWTIHDSNTKSPIFGLSLEDLGLQPMDVPRGTIMKTVFVEDETFFKEQILTGKVQGFSIGGLFGMYELPSNEVEEAMFSRLKSELDIENEALIFKVDDGSLVLSSSEAKFNGEKPKDGTYSNDKFTFSIVDGVLVDYERFKVGYEGEVYTDMPVDAMQLAKMELEKTDVACNNAFATARAKALASGAGMTANLLSRVFNVLGRIKTVENMDACLTHLFNLFGGEPMFQYAASKLIEREDKSETMDKVVVTEEIENEPEIEETSNILPIEEIEDEMPLEMEKVEEVKEAEMPINTNVSEIESIKNQVDTLTNLIKEMMLNNGQKDAEIEVLKKKNAEYSERMNKQPLPQPTAKIESIQSGQDFEWIEVSGKKMKRFKTPNLSLGLDGSFKSNKYK